MLLQKQFCSLHVSRLCLGLRMNTLSLTLVNSPVLQGKAYFPCYHFLTDFCFNPEKELKTKCVVEMEGNQTVLHPAITSMNKGDPR